MTTEPTPKSRKGSWIIVGLVIAFFSLLFFGMVGVSRWANHVTIPLELRKIPERYSIQPEFVDRTPAPGHPPQSQAQSPAPPAAQAFFKAFQALQNAPPTDPYKQFFDQMSRDKVAGAFLEQFLNEKDQQGMAYAGRLRPFWRNSNPYAATVNGAYRNRLFAWIHAHRAAVDRLYQTLDFWVKARESSAAAPAGRAYFELRISRQPEIFQMIVADGRMRLAEGNDAGVARAGAALLEILAARMEYPGEEARFLGPSRLKDATNLLYTWIDSRRLEPAVAQSFKAELDRAAPLIFASDRLARQLKEQYQYNRREFLNRIENDPWNSSAFGWDVNQRYSVYYKDVYIFNKLVMLPLPGPWFQAAVKAMVNKKHAPELIPIFDRRWQAVIDRCSRSYAEIASLTLDAATKAWAGPLVYCFPHDNHPYPRTETEWYARAARFNLMRAALDLRLHPQAAELARSVDFRRAPNHPWRDPFTGQALRLIKKQSAPAATTTLIYSLGPDLKDQQGANDYGPEGNEFVSPEHDDLAIHAR